MNLDAPDPRTDPPKTSREAPSHEREDIGRIVGDGVRSVVYRISKRLEGIERVLLNVQDAILVMLDSLQRGRFEKTTEKPIPTCLLCGEVQDAPVHFRADELRLCDDHDPRTYNGPAHIRLNCPRVPCARAGHKFEVS